MSSTAETRQCPYCGVENTSGSALCDNCKSPLTAYAGQLKGQDENREKVARQHTRLAVRPPAVIAMAVFDVFFALFWPLAFAIGSILAKPAVNSEGTNYIMAALGTIGPIFTVIVLLPFAIGLCVVAWATWNQLPWTWNVNLGVLALFALLALRHISSATVPSVFWLIVTGVLAALWFRSETKAWYGLA